MNFRQFDLNLLVALDALLRERNVTRAAERLFLSQPAMSGILARLRQAFGDELLVRVGRNLEPTEFAVEITDRVHACVLELEELLNSTRPFVPETESHTFRIAASDYAVLLLFGPLMQRLSAAAPNLSIRFMKLDLSAGERVAAGDVDFSILPAQFDPGLPSAPLFDDSWVCAAWSGHPSVAERMTLDEFLTQPHMAFNFSDPGHASVADEHLVRSGYERRIVASTESFAAAPFLLQGTPLLTMVPRRLAERLREAADIRLLELPFEVPPLREKLAWNPRHTSSPRHVWLREQLTDIARRL
jgi:LysR family transcriptional regulator, nod-box dependent transcriptional activator